MGNVMNSTLVLCILLGLMKTAVVRCQTYANAKAITDAFLSASTYNTDIRPLVSQDEAVEVLVKFQLVSIVEVNDVKQSFLSNGFLVLIWQDQMVTWNATQYGNVVAIHPHPKNIWRPRLVLLNTLGERDLFEDDASPVTITYEGATTYIPGGLFETSCDLNLKTYPFDDQECSIQMLPMGLEQHELEFVAGEVGLEFFSPNGEWELKGTSINASNMTVDGLILSSFELKFQLSRRPTFFVLNILLPVVLLSLLNMLVFTIPAESGEKVGYGITVVLAMSVFLSIVSGMLPRASDIVPNVTIYLFLLLIVSVLTVIDAIVIVFFYNREEKEVKTLKVTQQYTDATEKISSMNRVLGAIKLLPTKKVAQAPPTPDSTDVELDSKEPNQLEKVFQKPTPSQMDVQENKGRPSTGSEPTKKVNRYKMIGKYIDGISLVVFLMIWLIITCWYFISVLT